MVTLGEPRHGSTATRSSAVPTTSIFSRTDRISGLMIAHEGERCLDLRKY